MKRQAIGIGITATLLASVALPSKAHAQYCSPPRILIILDKSSSMTDVSADGVTSKWDVAVNAIHQVTTAYDNDIDFGLMVFPDPNQCSPGQVLVDIAPHNAAAIAAALGDPPPTGGNYTPMAQSLNEAGTYQPLLESGQGDYVLLITDGWQWCFPYDSATRFLPVDAVSDLKSSGITTYVVGFGASVDTLTLNRMAVASDTAFPGCHESSSDPSDPNNCYHQADNASELNSALDQVVVHVTQEICDGLDNDCNGLTDDNLTEQCQSICGTGTETCSNGQWVGCDAPQPTTEICDGLDNDCNGVTDEGCDCINGQTRACGQDDGACQRGTQTCVSGQWSECQGNIAPQTETCNNLDDDCDSQTDEDLHRSCQTACGTGDEICIGGQWGGCTAPQPTTEICDNIDNDCDGRTDENLSRPCQTTCGSGQEYCVTGQWQGCTAPVPKDEICDNIDNNCDGVIDEGCACIDGSSRPCGQHLGACEPGNQSCRDGIWSGCAGAKGPQEEACDNIDNDCDGDTDENLVRECQTACGVGHEICVNGLWHGCTAPRPSGEVCDGLDNDCDGKVDEGDGLCGVNARCVNGTCEEIPDAGPTDSSGPGAAANEPDACGCKTVATHRPLPWYLIFIVGLVLPFWRRRRRQ
ncbi:MAG: VWA domain-containing protein [Deltaproteobacteria bacterium]|nr:VWA domain-containing protein [Deltaproteobacteria bacterium]